MAKKGPSMPGATAAEIHRKTSFARERCNFQHRNQRMGLDWPGIQIMSVVVGNTQPCFRNSLR